MLGNDPRLKLSRGDMEVYLWSDQRCSGMGTLCTLGMSKRVQPRTDGVGCPSAAPRTELLAFCEDRDAERLAAFLLDLAAYPFQNNRHLFWWQTLPLGQPLVRSSLLDGVLLSMPPFSADEVTFKDDDNHRIDLIWVIPIASSELSYCRTIGIEAFERRLEEKGVNVADLYRDPIIP